MENHFKELYHRDVNKYTKTNNGLSYLSWSYVWSEVKKIDEKASYELHEFPMLLGPDFTPVEGVTVPYLRTPQGYFVRVSVTINGRTETETLPVMDNKNTPLGTIAPTWVKKDPAKKAVREFGPTPEPTSFDLNTSYKRCLAKAAALHGLGLYIFNGEDVPEVDTDKIERDRKQIQEWANKHDEVAKLLAELEHKAKVSLSRFNTTLIDRAYQLCDELVQKITNNSGKSAS